MLKEILLRLVFVLVYITAIVILFIVGVVWATEAITEGVVGVWKMLLESAKTGKFDN